MPHDLGVGVDLGQRQVTDRSRAMLPLKLRMSAGSETSGEKVSQALSFQ
jgi:hypothetical protein